MDMMDLQVLANQLEEALRELAQVAKLAQDRLLVIGCSTSEVMGEKIGSHSTIEVAEALYKSIAKVQGEFGFEVAFQCCEHLNRALIIERKMAKRLGLDIVNVVPQIKAGGSMATTGYANFQDPVAVEALKADAGIDIGDTFIGMHLKSVAVPVRLGIKEIGGAHLTAARVRPKFIGGNRAVYDDSLK